MKKSVLVLALFYLYLTTPAAFAQSSVYAGMNVAETTNVGFWGINPTLELRREVAPGINLSLRLNGFLDVMPQKEEPAFKGQYYHRSLYSDLGIDLKLVDRAADLSVGLGGTYQVGTEEYILAASYQGDEVISYRTEKTNLSRLGMFVKSTVDFGDEVSLNLTVYRFSYWGEYFSLGPSFRIN
jgi:hypothetical protein